ncbi:MAG: MFS transporter [Proteobacteria bacterium]|nr:MFS transporter [Pseudomonadota bacterium]
MVKGKPESLNNGADIIDKKLAVSIIFSTICRILLNTARRFPYPFAPAISRGLGVHIAAVTSMIAGNQAAGIFGIFLGPVADRIGYRTMMLSGLLMLAAGMLAVGFFPNYWIVMSALVLSGLAKSTFDPAFLAYVGERISFSKRGFVIGLTEFSWAGSTLAGIPLAAFLIDRFGWKAPFFALGILGLAGMITIRLTIPPDVKKTRAFASADYFGAIRNLGKNRSALGMLGFIFFISAANDNLFVVYGVWLEKEFNLSILALGLGTIAIGLAEFLGESLTALFSDRLGLKRSVVAGLVISIICYGVLPFFGKSFPFALGGLFVVFLVFEFTIVSSISLCTEFLPGARATMLSAYLAASGLGRVLGALTGGPVWLLGGLPAIGIVSSLISILALISILWSFKQLKGANIE